MAPGDDRRLAARLALAGAPPGHSAGWSPRRSPSSCGARSCWPAPTSPGTAAARSALGVSAWSRSAPAGSGRAPARAGASSSTSRPAAAACCPALLFALLLATLVHAQLSDAADRGRRSRSASGCCSPAARSSSAASCSSAACASCSSASARRCADLAEREAELARINEPLVEDSRRDPLTGMRNRRALADDLPRSRRGTASAAPLRHRALRRRPLQGLQRPARPPRRRPGPARDRRPPSAARCARATSPTASAARSCCWSCPTPRRRGAERGRARARAVQRAACPHPDGIGGVLTVSIGVAAGDDDAATLLARADAALYEAKRDGRNRVAAGRRDARRPADGRAPARQRRRGGAASAAQHARGLARRRVGHGPGARCSRRWPRRSGWSSPSRSWRSICCDLASERARDAWPCSATRTPAPAAGHGQSVARVGGR